MTEIEATTNYTDEELPSLSKHQTVPAETSGPHARQITVDQTALWCLLSHKFPHGTNQKNCQERTAPEQ